MIQQRNRGRRGPATIQGQPPSTSLGGRPGPRLASWTVRARTTPATRGGAHGRHDWLLLSPDRHRAGVAAARPAVALLRRHAHRRVPDRPGEGGRAPAPPAGPRPGGPGRGGADLGRLAVLRRVRRGAARPGPRPVLRVPGRGQVRLRRARLLAVRLHLAPASKAARPGAARPPWSSSSRPPRNWPGSRCGRSSAASTGRSASPGTAAVCSRSALDHHLHSS